jgi:hypothetical protein
VRANSYAICLDELRAENRQQLPAMKNFIIKSRVKRHDGAVKPPLHRCHTKSCSRGALSLHRMEFANHINAAFN